MTPAPVTCLSNASVSDVAQLMLEQAQLLPFDFRLRTAASDSDPLFD